MTKNAKEMTADELRAELALREKEEEEAKLAKEYELTGFENKFWAAHKLAIQELKEAEALARQAKKMAVEIAEKHGVPIDWDNGTYHPTTIDTWYTDPNNTKEQNEWMEEVIEENFYSVAPGDWWYPSRYC